GLGGGASTRIAHDSQGSRLRCLTERVDAQGWDERYADAELVWSGEPNVVVGGHLTGRAVGVAPVRGAGEGRNAVWRAMPGWDVTAVDCCAVGLEKARRMAGGAEVELATVVSDVETYEQVQ